MVDLEVISPNFNDRPDGVVADSIVLHYTGMRDANEALARMCDAEAQVSAHYMICENGKIVKMVDEEKRAWHAGVSSWRGRDNVNDFSIGVEIVNTGHEFGYVPFPDMQMDSVVALCKELAFKFNIAPENVIAHSDIAPTRKLDPGELFDWKKLADEDLALYVNLSGVGQNAPLFGRGDKDDYIISIKEKLQKFGYGIDVNDKYDEQMAYVVAAFRRRFVQHDVNGDVWDSLCDFALNQLIATTS